MKLSRTESGRHPDRKPDFRPDALLRNIEWFSFSGGLTSCSSSNPLATWSPAPRLARGLHLDPQPSQRCSSSPRVGIPGIVFGSVGAHPTMCEKNTNYGCFRPKARTPANACTSARCSSLVFGHNSSGHHGSETQTQTQTQTQTNRKTEKQRHRKQTQKSLLPPGRRFFARRSSASEKIPVPAPPGRPDPSRTSIQ